MTVLDASALLAFLFRESGHEQVATLLGTACISAVNLSEVLARFVRDGHDAVEVARHLAQLPLEVVPFTSADATATAALASVTRDFGLSIGDRACLALAKSRSLPAVTADHAWTRRDLGVTVRVIR